METAHTSCTAFAGKLADGSPVMGRNMDANVRNLFGKRWPVTYFAIRTAYGENGEKPYASIGMVESTCISKSLNFNRILDGRTDISPLALLPYFITDGVNEMGLSVTELTLFGNPSYAKDGEGSVNICEAMIIRYLLDNCSDLQEAIDLASTLNPETLMPGNDLHYFVVDANGDYAILEWVKDSSEGGKNALQVVRDIPYISNLFCSARARELSDAGRFENEALLPYKICKTMVHGKKENMQKYFGMDGTDKNATFNMSLDNRRCRFKQLKDAYNNTKCGIPGVFEDTDEAMDVLSKGFFSRTDGAITKTITGPGELTLYGTIYNMTDRTLTMCVNENEHRVFRFNLDRPIRL